MYRPKESYQRSLTKSETQLITLLRKARDKATDEEWKSFHLSLERVDGAWEINVTWREDMAAWRGVGKTFDSAWRNTTLREAIKKHGGRGVAALPPKLRT